MEGQHADHSARHPGSSNGVRATPKVGDRGCLPTLPPGQAREPGLAEDAAALRVDDPAVLALGRRGVSRSPALRTARRRYGPPVPCRYLTAADHAWPAARAGDAE